MAFPRFLFFDVLGAVVWATQAALLGYFAGKAFADQLWVAFVVAFAVTAARGRVRRGQGAEARSAGNARRRTPSAGGRPSRVRPGGTA